MNLVISALLIAGFYLMGYKLVLEGQWWVAVGLAFVTASFLLALKEHIKKRKVFKTIDKRRKDKQLHKASGIPGLVPTSRPLGDIEKMDIAATLRQALESEKYVVNHTLFDEIRKRNLKN
jgi:hypothetical protein